MEFKYGFSDQKAFLLVIRWKNVTVMKKLVQSQVDHQL